MAFLRVRDCVIAPHSQKKHPYQHGRLFGSNLFETLTQRAIRFGKYDLVRSHFMKMWHPWPTRLSALISILPTDLIRTSKVYGTEI
jgi:hypothetical protein